MVHGVKRLGYDYTNCSRALDLVRSRTGYFIYNSYLLKRNGQLLDCSQTS